MTKKDSTGHSKLAMSTLWDFSSIMKSADQLARIRYDSFFYYNQLFNSKEFANVYQELWNNQSEQIFTALIDYLNSFTPEEAAAINASRLLDAQRWEYDAVTLEDNTKEAVTWFTKRQQWMNEQFMTKVTAQRFVDTANSTVYSLTGQKISNPNTLKPGIYISKGKKFVVK
jgi:hypothetical protein